MKLFYNRPPSKMKLKKAYWRGFENLWEQASLPLGNGSLGMSIIGDIKKDKIVLNHKTLWAGGPSPKRPDYCGGNITKPDKDGKLPVDYYKEIYTAFKSGDDKKAHDLCEKLVGISDGLFTRCTISTTIWAIWIQRNNVVFKRSTPNPLGALKHI